jgi:AcrR family transcriptional regulator
MSDQPPDSPGTRESLLEAALACFAKYGYDATSIRLIASMAGKNTSLISYYFKGKEGLYREVIQYLLSRFPSRLDEIPLPRADGGIQSGASGLWALIRQLLIESEAYYSFEDPIQGAATLLFLNECHLPKPEVEDLLRGRMASMVNGLRSCIRAIRPGLSDAEIDFWGITLQGACLGHSRRVGINRLVWSQGDPPLPAEDVAKRLASFAVYGLLQGEPIPGIGSSDFDSLFQIPPAPPLPPSD